MSESRDGGAEERFTHTNVGANFDSYRDPEAQFRRSRSQRKRRRPTDWLNDRREGRGERALVPDVEVSPHDSYYGRNVVKAPPWGPQIPTYLFFGGLAAGSQVLAAGAYWTNNAPLRRVARLTSAVGIAVSGVCLVEDLGRPERFLNMLRVAKLSSPMSVGTWILTGFASGAMPLAALEAARMMRLAPSAAESEMSGVLSGVLPGGGSVSARIVKGVVKVLEAGQGPAVVAGAAFAGPLASYTAVLLSNTAMPTWAASYRHLPFVFAGSACAASGGVAMMFTPVPHASPARRLAMLGASADLAVMHRLERHLETEGVAEPLHTGRAGRLNKAAMALNIAGVATTALVGRTRAAAVSAGVAFAAASACTRFAIFEAGMASAKDPKYTIDPQRRRLAERRGAGNITTGPRTSPGPRTADGRRPLPGVDGPTNL